jgi:hypothetical protein
MSKGNRLRTAVVASVMVGAGVLAAAPALASSQGVTTHQTAVSDIWCAYTTSKTLNVYYSTSTSRLVRKISAGGSFNARQKATTGTWHQVSTHQYVNFSAGGITQGRCYSADGLS